MMMNDTPPKPRTGLPQWYLDATAPRVRTGQRNHGRRAVSADCSGFDVRMPMEAQFVRNPEYRRLRAVFATAERKSAYLTSIGAPAWRLREATNAVTRAGAQCAAFLLRNMAPPEPERPVILTRELGADGSLESETVEEVPATPGSNTVESTQ